MRDVEGKIIYVGKAKILANRVRSILHWRQGHQDADSRETNPRHRVHPHRERVRGPSPGKQSHQGTQTPVQYPFEGRKSYPLIRVTNEDFPRVFKTRRVVDDGSDYYGPFPNLKHLDLSIELADKLFPLRKGKGPLKLRKEPCLYYHLGRCLAPCIGKVTLEDYRKQVQKVKNLLSGKTLTLEKELTSQMKQASADMRFEVAADLRDTLKAIRELSDDRSVLDLNPEQRDYVAMVSEANHATFVVLQMRGGKVLGRDLFPNRVLQHRGRGV